MVVDLKTGKYAPTDTSLAENPQLGLYQLAVDHGAADEAVGRPVRSGGAELVQLRLGAELPKVQPQAPQVPGADGVTAIERQLMAAVRRRARRGVRRPAPATTATAATSTPSAPRSRRARCSRDPRRSTRPSSSAR